MPVKESWTHDPDHFLFRIINFNSTTQKFNLLLSASLSEFELLWRLATELWNRVSNQRRKSDNTMLRWTRARFLDLFSTTISSSVVGIFNGSCVFAFWRFSKIRVRVKLTSNHSRNSVYRWNSIYTRFIVHLWNLINLGEHVRMSWMIEFLQISIWSKKSSANFKIYWLSLVEEISPISAVLALCSERRRLLIAFRAS